MKFRIRKPSPRRRIAARASVKRFIRHSLGFKAPRGWGWLTNPKKAVYNHIYNRTTLDLTRLGRRGRRKGSGCVCCSAFVIPFLALAILILSFLSFN